MTRTSASPRGAAGAAVPLVLSLLMLLLLSAALPVQSATVLDLKNTIVGALQSINSGMTDLYSAFSAVPAVQLQYCNNALTNELSGMSLSMEALYSPYSVLATSYGFVIYKDNYVFGPSISLIGASAFTNGTLTTSVQSGSNNILVPYQLNTIIFVTGLITNSDGSTNILPMARYVMGNAYQCPYLSMNVGSLYTGIFSTAFSQLA